MQLLKSRSQHLPLIIAHRGLCSLFPENTIVSIEAGLFQADYSQFDVMLTKDEQLIIFHDNSLSRLTNIQEVAQFKQRRRMDKEYQKENQKNDWWVCDFDLAELKKLKLKQGQCVKKRPSFFNHQYQIPTLEQLIKSTLKLKQNYNEYKSGFLIQVKCNSKNYEKIYPKILKVLQQNNMNSVQKSNEQNLPVILQSFNQDFLKVIKNFTNLPLVQLIDEEQYYNLEQISQYAVGIGLDDYYLKKTQFKLIERCHQLSMTIFYYTLRKDKKKHGFQFNTMEQVIIKLFQHNIDGLITQFPEYTYAFLKGIAAHK